MPQDGAGSDMDFNDIRVWLERAEAHAQKCFICGRIAQGNHGRRGELCSIKLSGIDLTPEMQIAHLARCVGQESAGA